MTLGVICCAMIAAAFILPWYEGDYNRNGLRVYDDEYGLRDFTRENPGGEITMSYSPDLEKVGDLMSEITIVLALALAVSIIAAVLSYLKMRTPGVIVGLVSTGLILATVCVFFFGMIDALRLHSFVGPTQFNRTWGADLGPMAGWLLVLAASFVQSAQAVFMAYSGTDRS